MNSFYELTDDYLRVIEIIDDPDADEESLRMVLDNINDEIEVKADNYAKIIRSLETQIDGIKSEQKRLADRRAMFEKKLDFLKTDLYLMMKNTGKTKFKTDLFTFGIQKNGGALPVVLDVPLENLPDELIIVDEKPNLKAISDYIKNTGDLTYAHFGERGENIRIK